jgi:flagellar L-ring protein precursor FlgH
MRKMLQFEKSSVIKWPSRWQLFEKLTRSAMIIALLTFIVLPLSWAQTEAIHRLIEPKPNVAASSLSSYLERVREL